MLPGAPFSARGDLGDPLGAAGTFRGRPETLPRRSWGALEALLGAMAFQAGSIWLDWAALSALARPGWLDLAANDPND